ncbi:hypothetical protein [Escherichia phage vB-Eco-KMB37]|nr:hypothetical protein [Escherichia phage pEC-M2929-1AR.1]WQN06730.1 hypothetical protein [Escherichia phage vB-Eco-KMB37]
MQTKAPRSDSRGFILVFCKISYDNNDKDD